MHDWSLDFWTRVMITFVLFIFFGWTAYCLDLLWKKKR